MTEARKNNPNHPNHTPDQRKPAPERTSPELVRLAKRLAAEHGLSRSTAETLADADFAKIVMPKAGH